MTLWGFARGKYNILTDKVGMFGEKATDRT